MFHSIRRGLGKIGSSSSAKQRNEPLGYLRAVKLFLKTAFADGKERNRRREHFVFLFSRRVNLPPDVHDIKAYYISQEMLRRGMKVSWLVLGDGFDARKTPSGINLISIPRFTWLSSTLGIALVAAFCKLARVEAVIADEWLLFRGEADKVFAYEAALKKGGTKFVLDQRDPFIDFEISCGRLEAKSSAYKALESEYKRIYEHSDLVIVPSRRYEKVMVEEEYLPQGKVFGTFRGIDLSLFRPNVEPTELPLPKNSGKSKPFVIGWFGIMHPYRQIREVLVPLIEEITSHIQDAHVVIGGEGPEMVEFENLNKAEEKKMEKTNGEYSKNFTMLGFVPYSDLPSYLAACDVLLCPVDPRHRFSKSSLWLKIYEGLAVGCPVIATRTDVSSEDAAPLKGVVWIDGNLQSYIEALKMVRSNYEEYGKLAMEQAKHFEEYGIPKTVKAIVDRIIVAVSKNE